MSLESNIAALVAASTGLTQAVNITKATVEATRDSAIAKEAPVTTAKDAVLASTTAATTDATTTGTKLAAAAADYATQKTTKGLAAVQTSAESELKDRLHRRDPARHPFRGARPSLVMDFVRRECHRNNAAGNLEQVDLSSFMTFTRGSTATYVGPDGMIKSAAVNEARYGYDPVTGEALGLLVEEQRTNLVTVQDWGQLPFGYGSANHNQTLIARRALAPDGSLTAVSVTNTGAGTVYLYPGSTITGAAGTTVVVSGYTTTNTNNVISYAGVSQTQNTVTTIVPVASGWYRWIATATTTVVNATVTPQVMIPAGGTVVFWGMQCEVGAFPTTPVRGVPSFTGRASTASYIDSTGVLQTAAAGVARSNAYGYDASNLLRPIGTLVEHQSTNLLINGEGSAVGTVPFGWRIDQTFGGVNVSEPAAVVDARGYGAYRFRVSGVTTVSNRLLISPTDTRIGIIAGAVYTFSYNAQVVSGTYPYKLQPVYIWYDASMTMLPASFGAEITPTSLTRYSDTQTAPAGAAYLRIRFDFTGYWTIGTTVDFTFQLGGLQLEASTWPTSYIPTTTAQVTRAADTSTSAQVTRAKDWAIATDTNWFNNDAGTFSATAKGGLESNQGGYGRVIGGGNSACILGRDPLQGMQSWDGITVVKNSAGGLLDSNFIKGGTAYSKNYRAVSCNGAAKVSGTFASFNVKGAGIGIGCYRESGNNCLNGYIKQLTYFPRQLSDADLQALTILED